MSMTMIPPGTEHVRVAQSSNAVPGPSRTTGRGPRRWGEAPAAVVLAIVLLGSLVPRGWLPQGSDGADGLPFDAPSATHLLGTDITGRDVLAQTVTGGGLVVLVAAAVSGAVVGLCAVLAAAAALSARVRSVVRFGVETMLLVPSLLLLVTVMVSLSSWGVGAVLLACILAGVPYCAQVLLAAAVPLARAGFVQVALASGDTLWQVAVREVIPALGPELAAQLRLRFLEAVLVLSTAVFLGVSTPLAADSWAAMIRQNAPGLALNPWAVLAPALCLAAVGAAIAAAVGRRTAGGDAPDAETSDPVHRSCAPWASPEPAPGRVLILRGPSGSGKTTALHALAGEDPVGGLQHLRDLVVLGEQPQRLSPAALHRWRRRTVSYLAQDAAASLHPGLTAAQILQEASAATPDGPRRPAARTPGELLEALGVAELATARAGTMSGGQARRVGLAAAVARQRPLLLLDEPLSGLDRLNRRRVKELIAEQARAGTAVVMTDHHADALEDWGDAAVEELTVGADCPYRASDSYRASDDGQPCSERTSQRARSCCEQPSQRAQPCCGAAEPVLALAGLVVGHPHGPSIDSPDVVLQPGEGVVLVGRSGAGKTTLLHALAGIAERRAGTVTGRAVDQRRALQLVPQDPRSTLHPARSVRRQIEQALRRAGVPRGQRAQRAEELLASVGLEAELLCRRPHRLSGGQRQRVAVARALAAQPEVLLADEITAHLDAATARQIVVMLGRLQEQTGLAVLCASHDVDVWRPLGWRHAPL